MSGAAFVVEWYFSDRFLILIVIQWDKKHIVKGPYQTSPYKYFPLCTGLISLLAQILSSLYIFIFL